VQRVADGARAVVALVLEVAVSTAVFVRLVLDLVRGLDRVDDLVGRVLRRDRGPVLGELRLVTRNGGGGDGGPAARGGLGATSEREQRGRGQRGDG
jgi:hypothetical protein